MFAIFNRFRKEPHTAALSAPREVLYHGVVRLGRMPGFYQAPYNVPDTLDGRFDLLTFLIGTLCLRLSQLNDGQELSQSLFDRLFGQVELNLREAGVGDLSVPKQMRRMIQAFYGRVSHYAEILQASAPQPELAVSFNRNIYNEQDETAAQALAQWVVMQWWPVLTSFDNIQQAPLLAAQLHSLSDALSDTKGLSDANRAA
ncbi:MAG TPA: ubiquinol-cytochrome C chaperone family protein [Alphaproteobacteria bacterium]